MTTSHEVGRRGERAAVRWLRERGYRILETNYRWRRAEIDVIARDGSQVVFVEVKTRKVTAFGSPEGAVDRRKQAQIAKVAAHYLQVRGMEGVDCRFDVLSLREGSRPGQISVEHFRNAFWIDRRFVV